MGKSTSLLRGAVIGCRMGAAHARAMEESGYIQVVAVCDLNAETAASVAAKHADARVYTDAREMLERERPEVVAIATPNDSHARLTIMAAEAGVRGICCEKPMATCMREGWQMLEACRRHGVALIVNHQRRMSAPLVKMRQLIVDGAIGELYLLRGNCPGDILSDGTHTVDSLRWLAGDEEVKWVFGHVYRVKPPADEPRAAGYHVSGGYRYGHPVETGGFAVFEFASGVRAEMMTGELRFPKRQYQDYEVFGTKGRLWRQGDRSDPPVLIQTDQGGGWQAVPMDSQDMRRNPMTDSYREFVRLIRQGGQHPLSGESALKDLEILMAIYESARTHTKVTLPLAQEEFPLSLMLAAGQL